MLKLSTVALYGRTLLWKIERDRLDAAFTRIGSGFVTKNTLTEARECHDRISQILHQIQSILESDNKIEKTPMPLSFYREDYGRVETNKRLS